MSFFSSIFKSLVPAAGSALANTVVPGSGPIVGSALSGGLAAAGVERRNDQQIASAREAQAFSQASAREQMAFDSSEATKARDFAAHQTGLSRNFAERMSNTAHRREADDLAAAGLNRILSISKGGPGSSTPVVSPPSSAQARGSKAQGVMPQIMESVVPAMNTAIAVRRAEADVARTKEDTKLVKATEKNREQENLNLREEQLNLVQQRRKIAAETVATRAHGAAAATSIPKINQETVNSAVEQRRLETDVRRLQAELKGQLTEGEIDETSYGKVMRYVNRLMRALNASTNVANSARGRLGRR